MKTHLFSAAYHIKCLYSNHSRRSTKTACFGTLLLFLLCNGVLAADVLMSGAELLPGKEVRITAPKTGKTFLLYVPVDYTDKRPFPVLFYYHGYRGTATTGMFRHITKGKGFIIVGMNYATDDYYKGHLPPTKTAPEKAFFHEVVALVSARLNIAKDYIFMGGYSQGGYSTTVLGEQLLDRLAGFLILGAGRRNVDTEPPPAELIRGHPVFLGAGELDDPDRKSVV